jgi:hypothetical protein
LEEWSALVNDFRTFGLYLPAGLGQPKLVGRNTQVFSSQFRRLPLRWKSFPAELSSQGARVSPVQVQAPSLVVPGNDLFALEDLCVIALCFW